MNKNLCSVCGFDGLKEKSIDRNNPSYEICPCCGFEFGFDDQLKKENYQSYREKWIKNGAEWFIKIQKPKNWDLKKQLSNISIIL